MRKKLSQFLTATYFLSLLLFALGALAPVAHAQSGITDQALGLPYGQATGLAATDVRLTAAYIIRSAISLLGVIALVIIIYAGFTWMTAGGNDEKVSEAKKWMSAGVIGLAIILSAYAITSFVVSQLVSATQGGQQL